MVIYGKVLSYQFGRCFCFNIKGRGTVATGRVEQGTVKVGEEVEILGLRPVNIYIWSFIFLVLLSSMLVHFCNLNLTVIIVKR